MLKARLKCNVKISHNINNNTNKKLQVLFFKLNNSMPKNLNNSNINNKSF